MSHRRLHELQSSYLVDYHGGFFGATALIVFLTSGIILFGLAHFGRYSSRQCVVAAMFFLSLTIFMFLSRDLVIFWFAPQSSYSNSIMYFVSESKGVTRPLLFLGVPFAGLIFGLRRSLLWKWWKIIVLFIVLFLTGVLFPVGLVALDFFLLNPR